MAEQRERVRYSEDELALIYASAVTYDDLPVSWEGSFSETARRDILMGLASHPIIPARLGAAKQLGSYGDPEVMAALADLAVADQEPGVREAAAKSLATGGHCACVERILEIDPDPQPGDAARQALVWIRDLNPDCGASMPTDLERSIKRQVWGRRWRHYKGQVQATTLRGALGGLVGIGLGVGLFLGLISVATSSVEIEQVLAQWKLVVSLVTMGIPLAGMVGTVAAGSSAFVTALLGSLGDRAQDWRNWIFGTLTGAILMGLGFMLLGAIFAGEARLLQLFAAGALVGGLLIGVSAAPVSAPRWLIGILAVIAGVLAFILSGQLGWFDSPVTWWLVFMGSVAGIGFYLGLRPGREVS